jgi:hypothetical protein
MEMMPYRRTRFLGLEVHRDTIAVALAEETGQPMSHSTVANEPGAVRKLIQRLRGAEMRLIAAYGAGPTGYTLHRHLVKLGVESVVAAPSLIPKHAGDRVKTDRRDALKLARLLRSGDLTPVWVPDDANEAQSGAGASRRQSRRIAAKHRLSKFLLRQGVQPPPGMRNWSERHQQLLNRIHFVQLARGHRVHRNLLQPPEAPQFSGLPHTSRLRTADLPGSPPGGGIIHLSVEPGRRHRQALRRCDLCVGCPHPRVVLRPSHRSGGFSRFVRFVAASSRLGSS